MFWGCPPLPDGSRAGPGGAGVSVAPEHRRGTFPAQIVAQRPVPGPCAGPKGQLEILSPCRGGLPQGSAPLVRGSVGCTGHIGQRRLEAAARGPEYQPPRGRMEPRVGRPVRPKHWVLLYPRHPNPPPSWGSSSRPPPTAPPKGTLGANPHVTSGQCLEDRCQIGSGIGTRKCGRDGASSMDPPPPIRGWRHLALGK